MTGIVDTLIVSHAPELYDSVLYLTGHKLIYHLKVFSDHRFIKFIGCDYFVQVGECKIYIFFVKWISTGKHKVTD